MARELIQRSPLPTTSSLGSSAFLDRGELLGLALDGQALGYASWQITAWLIAGVAMVPGVQCEKPSLSVTARA